MISFVSRLSGFTLLLSSISSLTLPGMALADDPTPRGFRRKQPTTEYVAPLAQTTQPSYVPQSVALSGPATLSYEEGDSVPPGYTPVQRRRRGPIIAGAVLFGSLYLMSTLAAAASADSTGGDKNQLAPLWVPGVGPFIQMANTKTAMANYFLAIDGLGQVAGLALLIYGIASPKTVLVRNDLTSAKPSVRAAPIVTGHVTGVGLVGTF